MNNRRNVNKFDSLVESFTAELSKIPNFHLTIDDDKSNKVFSKVIFRVADIASYKELVINHFIPAATKAIAMDKKDLLRSRHKKLINIDEVDFNETLFDTIRVCYVGLFHKLENYINDVILIAELIFEEFSEAKDDLYKWTKDKFDFDIKDWRQFTLTHKINWISNCVKHKDGYPVKEPKPIGYEDLDSSQRIRIRPDEFKRDCQALIEFYPHYFRVILLIAQYKYAEDSFKESHDDIRLKLEEKLGDVENAIKNLISILRRLG